MGFTGLGLSSMLNQQQQDLTNMDLGNMARNIQIRTGALPHNAATYLELTDSHLGYESQKDVTVDNNQTFIFEYQALLRARLQQMISELTQALTRDLDAAMSQARVNWDNANKGTSMQGATIIDPGVSAMVDAGSARTAYNFFAGFAATNTVVPAGVVGTSNTPPTTIPYLGQPLGSPDNVARVAEDTPADALFGQVRSIGTATMQQGFNDDGITTAIMDSMDISNTFNIASNRYNFSGVYDNAVMGGAPMYAVQDRDGKNVTNPALLTYDANDPNLNDDDFFSWDDDNRNGIVEAEDTDGLPSLILWEDAVDKGKAKNNFEKVLWDTIADLEGKKLLKDILRQYDSADFLNNLQIASATSLPSGSQAQVSVFLKFAPKTVTKTVGGVPNTVVEMPHLGGKLDIQFDHWTAFYHS